MCVCAHGHMCAHTCTLSYFYATVTQQMDKYSWVLYDVLETGQGTRQKVSCFLWNAYPIPAEKLRWNNYAKCQEMAKTSNTLLSKYGEWFLQGRPITCVWPWGCSETLCMRNWCLGSTRRMRRQLHVKLGRTPHVGASGRNELPWPTKGVS